MLGLGGLRTNLQKGAGNRWCWASFHCYPYLGGNGCWVLVVGRWWAGIWWLVS